MGNSALGAFFGKEGYEIAAGLLGIAMVALLVSNAKGAAKIIQTTGDTFGGLIRTVTLQDNNRNPFNGF